MVSELACSCVSVVGIGRTGSLLDPFRIRKVAVTLLLSRCLLYRVLAVSMQGVRFSCKTRHRLSSSVTVRDLDVDFAAEVSYVRFYFDPLVRC